MLLEQLVKYTLEHHPDYQPLLSAVKETQRATETINEALREEQNKYSVIAVLERFDDSLDLLDMHLIQPHRKLIKEGVLLSAESDEDFMATEEGSKRALMLRDLLSLCLKITALLTNYAYR